MINIAKKRIVFIVSNFVKLKINSFILTAALLLFACGESVSEKANYTFQEKYQKNVDKIVSKREAMGRGPITREIDQENYLDPWANPAYTLGSIGTDNYKNARVNTSLLFLPPPPQEFLPNGRVWAEKKSSSLPGAMFAVRYLKENFPNSYKPPAISFNNISIPDHDNFGISSKLHPKNYLLIDNRNLSHNVNYLNTNLDDDDRKNIKTLIKEQKDLKRIKRLDILKKLEEDEIIELKEEEKERILAEEEAKKKKEEMEKKALEKEALEKDLDTAKQEKENSDKEKVDQKTGITNKIREIFN